MRQGANAVAAGQAHAQRRAWFSGMRGQKSRLPAVHPVPALRVATCPSIASAQLKHLPLVNPKPFHLLMSQNSPAGSGSTVTSMLEAAGW